MIENTLGSLMGLMGFTWAGTQFLKTMVKRAPQNLVALIVGELATVSFWQAGLIKLDGADPSDIWGWGVALFYGFFAVAASGAAHTIGQDPTKLVKRIKDGKTVN